MRNARPAPCLSSVTRRLRGRWPFVRCGDPPMPDLSFVIATRFGGPTLLTCLEAITRERERSGISSEVVLVADGTAPSDLVGVEEASPGLRLVVHDRPLGVASAYNRGFQEARSECAALLNDDMFLEPGYVEAALTTLENPRVFAAAAHVVETGSGAVCCGRNVLSWQGDGLAIQAHRDTDSPFAFYATGGGIFRRRAYLDLGGFPDLYAPFYWEDVHVGYQAWTRGLEIHYTPDARVVHHHRATVHRVIAPQALARIMKRNQWLFAWSNLTSPVWTRRLAVGGWRALVGELDGRDPRAADAYRDALWRLPAALALRRNTARRRVLTDEAIWEKVGAS